MSDQSNVSSVPASDSAPLVALWRRALRMPSLAALTPHEVESWAIQHGNKVAKVEEREVGVFAKTPAIYIELEDGTRGFLPKIPATSHPGWAPRRASFDRRAELWRKLEWFEPLWIPRGSVDELLKKVKHGSDQDVLETFNQHASTMYNLPFLATCVGQLVPQCHALREFCPLVRESFLAFFGGYRASSIAALIPLIEAALTRISTSSSGQKLSALQSADNAISRAIAKAVGFYFEGAWSPKEYRTKDYLAPLDERVFIFETFRCWLQNSFFERTEHYAGGTWLNRHLFAHGMSADWQQSSNFRRLIVSLTTLGVIESWSTNAGGVTLFFPSMNDDGRLLWQEAVARVDAQGVINRIAAARYHAQGLLAPQMPTDDGSMLRKAILAEDCINDLVRPLREAGWSVEVDDPHPDGLFVTLRAFSEGEAFRLALLYSCATSNEIYKRLAKEARAILYRGAPYHQSQYADGIDVHVGPVTGWQPPTTTRKSE